MSFLLWLSILSSASRAPGEGRSSCCCQKMNLTSSTPLWENCLCFFPPLLIVFHFFSPTCKISFRSNGNHLEQTPYSHVWGWTSCIFFAKSPYFQSVPLGCAPLPLTLPRGVFFSLHWAKRPKGFRGSACKSAAVPTGFQLKETAQCSAQWSLDKSKYLRVWEFNAWGTRGQYLRSLGYSSVLPPPAQVSGNSSQS